MARLTVLMLAISILVLCSCFTLTETESAFLFSEKLSAYAIFKGNPEDMKPGDGFVLYEPATPLFSDYAEKQRLIKVPEGKKLISKGSGLPSFPEETMLVKTFFYYEDLRDSSKGKRMLETRVMIKKDDRWNMATYQWDEEMSEAYLVRNAVNKKVIRKNLARQIIIINYHIPGKKECKSCHQSGVESLPIGLKLRNLNIEVKHDRTQTNQLQYLQSKNILAQTELSGIATIANWQDSTETILKRSRAYLDANCAHCHNERGMAFRTDLFLGYEILLEQTGLSAKKDLILRFMQNGRMPKKGTTIVHKEGVELIQLMMNTKFLNDTLTH